MSVPASTAASLPVCYEQPIEAGGEPRTGCIGREISRNWTPWHV